VNADDPHGSAIALNTLTGTLGRVDPGDTRAALGALRDGLALARACGLHAATVLPLWKARHGNAQACEYDIAAQLTRAPSLPDERLPLIASVTATADEDAGVAAVAEIQAFTPAAITLAHAGGAHAQDWPDRTCLLGSIAYLRSLGECWQGRHPSYALRLPHPVPPWWPSRTRPSP